MTDRRTFIKQAGTGCFAIAGLSGMMSLLSSCSGLAILKAEPVENKISIAKSEFKPEEKTKIIRANQLNYDILLVKEPSGSFHALQMRCTHFDNNLVANSKGLTCSLHGSTYDFEGRVTNGPAFTALTRYSVTTDTNNIIINLS
jgi:nitrite reductase/ring-hydroxylating ferredoxin subunit